MTTSNILAFLCGSLSCAVVAFLYGLHTERQNQLLIHAARASARREGYADGYQAHAMAATLSSPED